MKSWKYFKSYALGTQADDQDGLHINFSVVLFFKYTKPSWQTEIPEEEMEREITRFHKKLQLIKAYFVMKEL